VSAYIYRHLRNVRIKAESSYGAAATTAAANFVEVVRDSAGIKHTPTMQGLDTATHRRAGQKQILVARTTDVAFTSRVRAHTIPAVDDNARPANSDALFKASGALLTSAFGASPRTLTYAWADYPEAMESVTVEEELVQGAGTNAYKKVLDGVRGSLKISAAKGAEVVLEFAGKGQTYTASDKGLAANDDPTPSASVLQFYGATVTLEELDGSPTYSGPVEAFEIDTGMNVTEVATGTTTGYIDEVLLQPMDAMTSSITIAAKLIATFNADKLLNADDSTMHCKISLVDLTDSNNTLELDWYASIVSVEESSLVGGQMGYKLNLAHMWYHAATPGVTPATSLTATFKTVP